MNNALRTWQFIDDGKTHLGPSSEQDLDAASLPGAGCSAEGCVSGEAVRGVGVDFGHVEEELERLLVPGLRGGHGRLLRGLGQAEVADEACLLGGGARGRPVAAHQVADDVEVAEAGGEDERAGLELVHKVDGSACKMRVGRLVRAARI